MDTSFLCRVSLVFVGTLLTLFFSSCQKTTTSPSSLSKMAIKGDAVAHYNLGKNYPGYDGGRGVPQDYLEAMRWYRKAADQEDAKAQFNLAS